MDLTTIADGAFQSFKNFQTAHPHIGAMLNAEVVYISGDLVSQLINDKKVDVKKLKYTATIAPLYGLMVEGCIETGEIVGRNISESPLVKAALGPNLFGNLFNTFFFVNNTVGEKNEYKIGKLASHYLSIFFP